MNKRLTVLVMTLLGVFLLATAVQARTVLRIAHTLDPTSHYHKGLMQLDEMLKSKTNGDMSLDIYHSAQLGSERDAIDGVNMGTIEMTLTSSAPLAGISKSFMVFDLPFIITDRKKAYTWMDGPEGQKLLEAVGGPNMMGLSIWENGFRHLTNSKKAVVKPEDLGGLKIRLMENPIHTATFKALGAEPMALPFGELFAALQQNTVDGQENPLVVISTSRFFEVQKHLTLTGHFYSPAVLLINKPFWDKLTDEQRGIITESVAQARDWERNYSEEVDKSLAEELKKNGMEVSAPEKDAWMKALEPVYKEFEEQIGKELIESLQNAQK